MATPWEELGGVVCVIIDMAMDPGKVYIQGPVRFHFGRDCCQGPDRRDVVALFRLGESAPFGAECWLWESVSEIKHHLAAPPVLLPASCIQRLLQWRR
jgi:hypothetical protein